jgi:hypothetical protein
MYRYLLVLALTALVAGCGSSQSKPQQTAGAEAQSAASGDIPDNQVFLTYHGAGYSLAYPEGWSRSGAGSHVAFRDKSNSVVLRLGSSSGSRPGRRKLSRVGPPNPVTGKRPLLIVDRYVYVKGKRSATLDESTPKGVDNVDAYRMIAKSFRWR